MADAEQCQGQSLELWETLRGADAKWRGLERSLGEAEERVLSEHAVDMQKWFGKDISEKLSAQATAEGGLRRKIRDRVEKLLLVPLSERICKEAQADIELLSGGAKNHPIDALLEHYDTSIKPMLDDAVKEDARIVKKLRRLEKVGALRDVKNLEQKRVALWPPVREAIAAAGRPVQALAHMLDTEFGSEAVSQAVAALPAIVARAVCDWHYQRCAVEFEQLSSWWVGARAALERRPDLWDRLLEQEGIFVRRIERGIDEIHTEKCRYIPLANFGHSGAVTAKPGHEWPAESAAVLARSVNEMQRRLRPVRDCAAYRIMDAANSILKAIAEEELSRERSPWEQIGHAEGMATLCRFLGIPELSPEDLQKEPKGLAAFGNLEPDDTVLCMSNVLDSLVGVISDLAKLADDWRVPDTGGVSYILEEVLQAILYVQEDLLVVLDDATQASLGAWLSESWGEWCVVSAAGRLDKAMTAMPLKGDSKLAPQDRQARRTKLSLMRGLQALLDDNRFRALLLERAASPQDVNAGAASKAADVVSNASLGSSSLRDVLGDGVDLEPLYKKRSEASGSASPRSGYVPRKPEQRSSEETATPPPVAEPSKTSPSRTSGKTSPSRTSPPALNLSVLNLHAVADPFRQSRPGTPSRLRGSSTPASQRRLMAQEMCSPDSPGSSMASGRASTPSLKAVPSWLNPPWPRPCQEVPFDSWSRPCTPSTVCDEADFLQTPKFKFVDGQCVSLRLGSSSKRLPPLNSGLSGSMRKAWQM